MCDLTNPIFTDEAAAIAHMEADRWPTEVTCPLCGVVGETTKMGGKTQAGMFLCNACRGKFTVLTGTVFARSHIPAHKWLLALELMAASKKGISAHQLHRMLGITYKSAWFMAMRIREAMAPAKDEGPLGGPGKIVEADELYTGKKQGIPVKRRGSSHKMAVVSLVERGGRARSFHMDHIDDRAVAHIVMANVAMGSRLHTDESQLYKAARHVMKHETVNHSRKEYARGDVTTNSVEGYFSVFERGIVGVYQHVSEQHLHRYLAEFDFRQNNRAKLGIDDATRANRILRGAENKRLTYRQVG
jgi:transposase-like protein